MPMDGKLTFRFLTGSLKVDYLKPTPLGVDLEIRALVQEIKGRKVVITSSLSAEGIICARGEAVCIQVPESYLVELQEKARARQS